MKNQVRVGVGAEWKSGVAENLELRKGSEWGWYDLSSLPKPRFATLNKSVEAYKKKRIFFDSK